MSDGEYRPWRDIWREQVTERPSDFQRGCGVIFVCVFAAFFGPFWLVLSGVGRLVRWVTR